MELILCRVVESFCLPTHNIVPHISLHALPYCVGVGLVRQVRTHYVRSAQQLVHELQVQEEVEGVRQEVREVKRGEQGRRERSLHEHVDDMDDKYKTHDLSHGECARDVTLC